MKVIYGVRKYPTPNGEKSFWTQIGTVLTNKDGSLNLIFDYIPTDKNTRVQIREKSNDN